jgi:hypothetical protein
MTATQKLPEKNWLVGAEGVKEHVASGAPITIVDVRNDKAWESSSVKIAGAARVRPAEWRIDPSWLDGRIMVFY